MTITIGELIAGFSFIGAIVGVWVRNEVSVARLKERVIANEKQQGISDTYYSKVFEEVKKTMKEGFDKITKELQHIDDKIVEIKLELANKVDK